jgi:hypothetical protein
MDLPGLGCGSPVAVYRSRAAGWFFPEEKAVLNDAGNCTQTGELLNHPMLAKI